MSKSELRRRIKALEAEARELRQELRDLSEDVSGDLDRLEERTVDAGRALSFAGRTE